MAIAVQHIPDMARRIGCVACAIIARLARALHIITELVDLARPIRAADGDAAPALLQRLQQVLTQMRAGFDGEIGIIGNIREAVHLRDFRMQHVAHEEMFGETDTA